MDRMPAAPSSKRPGTTRWLTPVEMQAWRAYVDSINDLQNALEADLVSFGLTMGDYEVLVRLSERPDRRLRMCDLASELQLSPSGLTRRLDGLVSAGLVARAACDGDRRVMLAVLTDEGFATLERAAPYHVAGVRRQFIDLLSAAEVRAIASAFDKVRRALNAAKQADPS